MGLNLATMPAATELSAFATTIGDCGPVAVEGGRTKWGVGGEPAAHTRLVRAPEGVVDHVPEEMTVRVLAGTRVTELHGALAAAGQRTVLPDPPGATVGGVLAVGWSDVHRLGRGPVRDTLLQATYVSAEGRLVTVGGPTVKNVTGFDVCRLLVGSLGTLGLLGEVILRTVPLPRAEVWLGGEGSPLALTAELYRPSALLWDGTRCWVHLEGHRADVESQRRRAASLGVGEEISGPPELPGHRWSLSPAAALAVGAGDTGGHVIEVGVGIVHAHRPPPAAPVDPVVTDLHRRLADNFDPHRRLNPGRDPLWGGRG